MASSWTDGRLRAFIISVLRSGTRRYPPKFETLNEAKTEKKVNKNTGRVAQHYLCAACSDEFPATQVQVDHIEPVVPLTGFTTWDDYISRLFCPKDNLQVLCKACHAIKTSEEKKLSKLTKQSKPRKGKSSLKGRSVKKS